MPVVKTSDRRLRVTEGEVGPVEDSGTSGLQNSTVYTEAAGHGSCRVVRTARREPIGHGQY